MTGVSSRSPGSDTPDPADGFAVTNADGVPLWDFVRDRDLQAVGYPISQRWVDGPFTLQGFQKVILQWDPGAGQMNYYNTLDVLANRYPQVNLPNVPVHEVLAADFGADFATVTQNHLAILERNDQIKARFLAEPDWLNLYGLPIRYEAREVNGNPEGLQVLRTQRTVFVVWNVPAPGTTVGQVLLQNVPDKVKKLTNVIIPDAAKAPIRPEAVGSLPRFTLSDQAPPSVADRPKSLEGCDRGVVVPNPAWHPELVNDCRILLQIRDVLVADGSLNWAQNRPITEWLGIGVGGSPRRVRSLSISGGERGGSIPHELAGLTGLRELEISSNASIGTVPRELGRLVDLRILYLSQNSLSGTIPVELAQLANLRYLNLAHNQISDGIPPELSRLSKLQVLHLSGNRLTGRIPPQLGQLGGLTWLHLRANRLTGGIPADLGKLSQLRSLDLSANYLSGTFPVALTQLPNLERLGLGAAGLTGEIPGAVGQLTSLRTLELGSNQLTGPIPPALGQLTHLEALQLSHNRLTGTIPSELADLVQLKVLGLVSNRLTGQIPEELGRLTVLKELHLTNKRPLRRQQRLANPIPVALGALGEPSKCSRLRATGSLGRFLPN